MEEQSGSMAKKNTAKRWLIAAGTVLGVLAAAYLAACAYVSAAERFYPRTEFFGVDYGGLTVAQAEEKMRAQVADGSRQIVVFALESGEEVMRFPLGSLALEPDCAAIVRGMYGSAAQRGGFFEGGFRFLMSLVRERDCSEALYEEEFSAAAEPVLDALACEAIPFDWQVKAGGIVLTRAKNGRRVTDEARAQIADALRSGYFNPHSARAVVTLRSKSETAAGEYEEIVMQPGDLTALRDSLIGEKVNAAYDKETGTITPDHIGAHFELSDLTAAMDAAVPGETFLFSANIELPDVTAAELEACLFRDVLGSYTTHASGTAGRRGNVKLSAESCSGVILNSGDIFDYDTTIGPRTAERGYQLAPGYIQGKTVDMIGGGICQTSSTLYAAVLHADLEIVKRTNHGFASDYIGLGLDATVSGGGPEFQFCNNTPYPIRIDTAYDEKNNLTVTIMGTKTDDTYVKIVTQVLSTTPFEEIIEETDELAPGERRVEQTAYTGYDVRTYRNIYSADGTLLSSTFEARSRYNKRDRIILVGKAASPTIGTEPPPYLRLPEEQSGQEQPTYPADPAPAPEYPDLPPVPSVDIG